MNIKVFSWWLILLGVLGTLGTGIGYLSLKDQANHAYMQSVMTFGSARSAEWQREAHEAKRSQERLVALMAGSGVALLFGIGMCLASGGTTGRKRPCPQCAEIVLAAAFVCKHCGAKLAPQQPESRATSSYRALAKATEEAERRTSRP